MQPGQRASKSGGRCPGNTTGDHTYRRAEAEITVVDQDDRHAYQPALLIDFNYDTEPVPGHFPYGVGLSVATESERRTRDQCLYKPACRRRIV